MSGSGYVKQHRGFHGMYSEDNWTASQRMESTSRLETKLDNETAREEGADQGWLAAGADGGVRHMQGQPDAAALESAGPGDSEIDVLRKNRIAQMKARAQLRSAWLAKGHGVYAALSGEGALLSELPKHERAVVLFGSRGAPSHLTEALHLQLRQLSVVHVETYFAHLDAEEAPLISSMVELAELPTLLLCEGGRVTGQLAGVDRTFTTEGVAYELGQRGLVHFDDGIHYGASAGGCTTATARRAREGSDSDEGSDLDD